MTEAIVTRMCTRAERAAVCRARPARAPTLPTSRSSRYATRSPAHPTRDSLRASHVIGSLLGPKRVSREKPGASRPCSARIRDVWLCVLHRSTAQRAMGYIPVCTCRRRDASTRARARTFPLERTLPRALVPAPAAAAKRCARRACSSSSSRPPRPSSSRPPPSRRAPTFEPTRRSGLEPHLFVSLRSLTLRASRA